MKKHRSRFLGKNIGVIGDIMLDRFIWGATERLSPEATVPVILSGEESANIGGAANVARNIASLGGRAFLIGVVGDDATGDECRAYARREELIDMSGVFSIPGRTTTEKIRVMLHGKQVVRIDREMVNPLFSDDRDALLSHAVSLMPTWDALVISDYAKGVVSEQVVAVLVANARERNIPVIADMKPQHIPLCASVTILTSNAKEVTEAAGVNEIDKAAGALQKNLGCSVLVTKDKDGLILFDGDEQTHIPHAAKAVKEVSGAGDTVTAGMALALAGGLSMSEAARLANAAAGIVVGKTGVAVVTPDELEHAMMNI